MKEIFSFSSRFLFPWLAIAALLCAVIWPAFTDETKKDNGETGRQDAPFQPIVPRTWDDAAMADLEIPLAEPAFSPRHVPAEYYYRIPVRPIYKSYPVYHPDKEPSGYLEKLQNLEPEVLWDDRGTRPGLNTKAEWLAAGSMVFESPSGYPSAEFPRTDRRICSSAKPAGTGRWALRSLRTESFHSIVM